MFYRHKSNKKFRPVPPLHCIPHMYNHHNDDSVELESLLQLVESVLSELDFSETRRKWGVSMDVIFDQIEFGGVAVKKTKSLWNTFQKVGSVTVLANKNCMLLVFIFLFYIYLFILLSKSIDAADLS